MSVQSHWLNSIPPAQGVSFSVLDNEIHKLQTVICSFHCCWRCSADPGQTAASRHQALAKSLWPQSSLQGGKMQEKGRAPRSRKGVNQNTCSLDPRPPWLGGLTRDTDLDNAGGRCPHVHRGARVVLATLKEAVMCPLLKKPPLDADNFPFLGKTIEKVAVSQLQVPICLRST